MGTLHEWLDLRRRVADAVPDAVTIALMVARNQNDGLTLDQLRRKSRLDFDVLDVLLRRLLGKGQLITSQMDGRRVFRPGL